MLSSKIDRMIIINTAVIIVIVPVIIVIVPIIIIVVVKSSKASVTHCKQLCSRVPLGREWMRLAPRRSGST